MQGFRLTFLAASVLLHGVITSASQAQAQVPFENSHVASNVPTTYSNETLELLDFHRQLVQIHSVSGEEHEIGMYLASYLESHGFTVKKQQVPPIKEDSNSKPRFNVYAYNGDSLKARVLVTSHMDTVPPFYNYTYNETSNRISGRGSVDAKASVAAQTIATLSLLSSKEIKRGDVALLFVCGEEVDGGGMKYVNDLGLHWETGIFGEPTELRLAEGHKGIATLTLRARGRAAHSGYPWLGDDANSKLIRAMAAIDKLDLGRSEKYGQTTINIGRIDAGVAGNVVSASGYAFVQIRVAAGTPEEIRAKVEEAAGDDVEYEWKSGYPPVDCDADVEGFEKVTVNYGTDVPNLESHRLKKRYLYGPGTIFVAHGDHEGLQVEDLTKAVSGYKKLIKHALQN